MTDIAQRGNKLTRTGYAKGGRIGKAGGGWMLRKPVQKLLEGIGGGSEGKPHSTRAGRISAGVRKIKRGNKLTKGVKDLVTAPYKRAKKAEEGVKDLVTAPYKRAKKAEGGRIGKGSDWEKGKFSEATLAAMKKHDFPGGSPHQTVAGKKAALQHATIRAREPKKN